MLDPVSAVANRADPLLDRRRLNRALFAWHNASRRGLVVRGAATPWAILVGEVMSQQTQIDRIGPAWERWIARWPAPADLAAAPPRDVVTAWAGLGYNRRALALHDAAKAIVRDHEGRVPSTVEALEALPGIGPYTARAVAASAFGRPVAPLDVNVRRVVERLLGVAVGRAALPPGALQSTADGLVARRDPRRWVDAVMDLAATICTRRAPRCAACPLRTICPSAGLVELSTAPARAAQRPLRFEATNRWLRGRLLDAARHADGDGWIGEPQVLGTHPVEAIGLALGALQREGFIDREGGRYRLRAG